MTQGRRSAIRLSVSFLDSLISICETIISFNTFIKAVEILDLFLARKTSLGAIEISDSLSIPRSTTYKYLSILKEHRFLDYDSETNKFSLGFKFFEFGAPHWSSTTNPPSARR